MPALDIAIVGITILTGVYCLILNHRLAKLHDLKGGLGGAVATLARSVSQMKQESEAVAARMHAACDRTEQLLARADACEPKIDTLLETMDRQARAIWREDKARAASIREEMLAIAQDAKTLATLLNDQLCAAAEDPPRVVPLRERSPRGASDRSRRAAG